MTGSRERLQNRRASRLFSFTSMGMRFTCSISRYPDGRVGELFCDSNNKAGSAIGTLVRDAAILLSFALQHGANIDSIRKALCRDSEGRPLGPIAEALDLIVGDVP